MQREPAHSIVRQLNKPPSSKEVHVWQVPLDRVDSISSEYNILSGDERARAARFHFEQDRIKFVMAHGALRVVLAGYLGVEPSQLEFCKGSAGKPELALECNPIHLGFNFSHSHDLALIGVTLNRKIGVDVEYIRPIEDADQLVERFFSPREQSAYRALPAHQKHQAFFNGWTRKEAFIKATGAGLSYSLDRFDVSLEPGKPAQFLRIGNDSQEISRWLLRHLSPGPEYIGAIAVEASAPSSSNTAEEDICLTFNLIR
jgi:4'-phosphopantetheinyl transferase